MRLQKREEINKNKKTIILICFITREILSNDIEEDLNEKLTSVQKTEELKEKESEKIIGVWPPTTRYSKKYN